MRKMSMAVVVACALAWLVPAQAARAATHRFGAGANYWKTLSDIEVEDVIDIDESGLSWLASYQYVPEGIFKFEADLEYYPNLGGEPKSFWSPEVFVLVGGGLYAGAGVGVYYNGDIFSDTPFFMLRAGIEFAILPFISLDINANYRFNDWDTFSTRDLDTDTIRLGAVVRVAL